MKQLIILSALIIGMISCTQTDRIYGVDELGGRYVFTNYNHYPLEDGEQVCIMNTGHEWFLNTNGVMQDTSYMACLADSVPYLVQYRIVNVITEF